MIALACAVVVFAAIARAAVQGVLPPGPAGPSLTFAFLGAVLAAYRAVERRGLVGPRPLVRRHGFWLVALGAAIALPRLGAASLVDPWETHYAEVAREILERHDPISLWWGHEGWFRSKPVLLFWLEAIAMRLFGAGTGPDAVLAGGAHPEWAVRLPGALFAIGGAYFLYHGVARTCGRRAGFVGAVLLWSMPGFAMVSQQAITDTPMIGAVAAAIGLSLRALHTSDAELAPRLARIALASLVALVSAAQLVVVAADRGFSAGSPNACGLPGQPACVRAAYAHPAFHGWHLALLLAPLAAWAVISIAEETRAARLFALGAWLAAGLAVMAKGPVGLAIHAAAVLFAVVRRPRVLLRLEVVTGLALVFLLVAPWYLASWARHGKPFLDELVMRHMLGRTLDHLHDTNAGADVGIAYYVKQLGYATFPLGGVVLAGVVGVRPSADPSRRAAVKTMLFAAALGTFVLVSAMRTKFHHYVLPALPPLAMLAGIGIDERLGERPGTRRFGASVAVLLAALALPLLVARDLARSPAELMRLFTYRYDRQWVHSTRFATSLVVLAALATASMLAFAFFRRTYAALAVTGLATAWTAIGLLVASASDGGQRAVIAAYERDRATHPTSTPLLAYQLNWKGESYYTGNHLAIFVSAPLRPYVAERTRTDHTLYAVTERARVPNLVRDLAPAQVVTLTSVEDSAEFALVRADFRTP